jgi:hypothetical protein
LPASEKEFLPSVQFDVEGRAAARAVEHAQRMPAGAGFQDAAAPVLDTRHGLAVELEPPVQQADRTALQSFDAETPDGRGRGTSPRRGGADRRLTRGGRQDVCLPLAGGIDRLPRSVERFQASFGISVAGMQIGMAGPNRVAKSSPDVFPRRFLIDPEKGEQRLFIRGASHRHETLRGRAAGAARGMKPRPGDAYVPGDLVRTGHPAPWMPAEGRPPKSAAPRRGRRWRCRPGSRPRRPGVPTRRRPR